MASTQNLTLPSVRELLPQLPAIHTFQVKSISAAYGADYVAASHCGLDGPPTPLPGIWQHGWLSRQRAVHPAVVISGYGAYEDVKEKASFWVAREDQESYLRQQGYLRARAIGLPLVYLPERVIERIDGSLLVMPVHSLPYTKHKWQFEEYADAILQLRERFSQIAVCVHPSCLRRGYWVDAFERRGFTVITGAGGDDRNALLRLQTLMSSFEYVTTNGHGSHLTYAAHFGARVSIYGPFAQFERSDYANTQIYQEFPEVLESTLHNTSEAELRRYYPFLFCEPDRAVPNRSWGADELGLAYKKSPDELQALFEWDSASLRRRRVAASAMRLRRSSRRFAGRFARLFLGDGFRMPKDPFADIRGLPRWTSGTTLIYGKPFEFQDVTTFLHQHEETILGQVYRFASADPSPYIIDVGARLGLSVIYFKHLYPRARVTAFEPDPQAFEVLTRNCDTFELEGVELYNEVIATQVGAPGPQRMSPRSEEFAGTIAGNGSASVPSRRLRDLLTRRVNLLRLDLEGLETDVLDDCGTLLENVDHLFVSYHSPVDREQTLHRMFATLHHAGFRVHIHASGPSPQPLFLRDIRDGTELCDMKLNIFCYRM